MSDDKFDPFDYPCFVSTGDLAWKRKRAQWECAVIPERRLLMLTRALYRRDIGPALYEYTPYYRDFMGKPILSVHVPYDYHIELRLN